MEQYNSKQSNKEGIEYAIVINKQNIDKYMHPEDGSVRCAYKAIPFMIALNNAMTEYMHFDDIEYDTCCMIYSYLGECFSLVPFLPLAADCYKCALECASISTDAIVRGEIEELLYNAVKYRNTIAKDKFFSSPLAVNDKVNNYHVYDDCNDIKSIAAKQLGKEETDRIVEQAINTACRSLLADSVEHSNTYLDLLPLMHEELEKTLESVNKEHGFCHIFWAAKKVYLKSKGITWQSPSQLNPSVKFE